ncbi:MAG: methylmalonyl-CoA mutase family protein [Deltaproteobacteria bacterium]|nr:methylmalonyl-CoA mutase family protein [Deltaproteobacteria bacterium]
MNTNQDVYKPKNNIRIVTATSLFDGHDAAINIMRRILQSSGAEVIHLGINRSVKEIVDAALEEDAQGISVSSYQGGHMEFFKYMVDMLKEKKAEHIKIFGGGGGVIVPEEAKELQDYGVTKLYSPEDGAKMGLQGMINHMMERLDFSTLKENIENRINELNPDNKLLTANFITAIEQLKKNDKAKSASLTAALKEKAADRKNDKKIPVIGITGTGGAGKSSLTDELILRFLRDIKDIKIAIICSDPSKRKTGGALLGDRIRMNAIDDNRVYMRSLATRESLTEVSEILYEAIQVAKASEYDLIITETAGIGQGDSRIADISDISLYVMTSEFGAASQLEKIDMLDYADLIAINKFEKKGSEDALRDVRKQFLRNKNAWEQKPENMPIYGTIASKFNDDGVTALYFALIEAINKNTGVAFKSRIAAPNIKYSTSKTIIIPPEKIRYLSEISDAVRKYHEQTETTAQNIEKAWHLKKAAEIIEKEDKPSELFKTLKNQIKTAEEKIDKETENLIKDWDKIRQNYKKEEFVYTVRDKTIKIPLYKTSLSQKKIPKISLPNFKSKPEIYRWLREENLPGRFPFTAGVFPLKRADEDPTRMFAGEGDPARTNRRFKLLSGNYKAKRLSTAFDSVTLYGRDPEIRPDIYGKVGTSGVSICTLEDVKVLYDGFDLASPNTSVSMTINGPAPIILAMFLNAAIDRQTEKFKAEQKRDPSADEAEKIKADTLSKVRGTVQADILKEDQGQNTCMFSTDFALKMMGDIQEYFIQKNVRNFYSVSISGYHIAEAGANPITQLAFTLANGFTYVEYYLSRGMDINAFAPNLSFFFSNGMDAEYTVIGRVARRIWAIALKEKYGASVRSQMLKYHIQTSGRSLHSQEIQFNDIRTTLQALCAIYDNCNSLHTNAFDEAITTPSQESVRRALAIQLIINREWGLAINENVLQGSFIVEELTSLVEKAVLSEFDRITERGGVLGAMETGYQRNKIQDESLYYEHLKHTGKHPIIGVNTFREANAEEDQLSENIELARATEEEKNSQLARLDQFQKKNQNNALKALKNLQEAALANQNVFEELMNTVQYCSLGQITKALHNVGGKYRRNI